jgi:hypothetical protein
VNCAGSRENDGDNEAGERKPEMTADPSGLIVRPRKRLDDTQGVTSHDEQEVATVGAPGSGRKATGGELPAA